MADVGEDGDAYKAPRVDYFLQVEEESETEPLVVSVWRGRD
jgi:hypothetical protein